MKRKIACLLAAVFVFHMIPPAYAIKEPVQAIVAAEDVQPSSTADGEALAGDGQTDGSDDAQGGGTSSEDASQGDQSGGIEIPSDGDQSEENPSEGSELEEKEPSTEGDQSGADSSADREPGEEGSPADGDQSGAEPSTDGELGEEEIPGDSSDWMELMEDESVEGAEETELEAVGNAGQVDVSIGAALILQNSAEFTIQLSGPTEKANQTITLAPDSEELGKVCFEELKAGDYTLTVSAPRFATYSQKLKVDQKGYAVKLMTGFLAGMTYEKGQTHPGVLLIGDVTGDGKINDTDKTALVDDIDAGKDSHGQSDLSGDGKVNLVDLEYFTKGYQVTGDTSATVEQFVPAAVIQPKAAEGTKVEGDLNKLLKEEASVTLTPENGQTISDSNPVALEFDFSPVGEEGKSELPTTDGIIIETGTEDNRVKNAVIAVTYVDETGTEQTVEVPVTEDTALARTSFRATVDQNGTIQVNLGAQIAVKKVTLTIKGMLKNTNLAEISKVEFVNGMEDRIPEPEMDIPENLKANAGNKQITLTWDKCVNVTGYEVWINEKGQQDSKAETIQVTNHSIVVTTYGGKELKNLTTYTIKVQSVNGTWRSGYCGQVEATPQPTGRPDKPDRVTATGKYKSIVVSWKDMNDTESYNLYYKESSSEDSYTKVEAIRTNTYTVSGLKELTDYTVYVTGVNSFGESDPSLSTMARTTDLNPAVVPKYGLINTGEEGEKSAHIISVTRNGGEMRDSPLDTDSNTAWGLVDHNAGSYYYKNSWDDGGYNALGRNGITYEFDQAYQMDTIILLPANGYGYFYARMAWWDEDGNRTEVPRTTVSAKKDSEDRPYYVLKLPKAGNVKKIQIGLGQYSTSTKTAVAEAYFYHYDTLMDEIMALYEDDLHTVLKETTTQEVIDALRTRVNTPDEVSGEYNPNRTALLRELDTAEKILKDGNLKDAKSVELYNSITTNDVSRGFGGLNAWQPLGVVAAAGEEITIYVGHNSKKTGDSTDLRAILTQYHAESNGVLRDGANLKVGANTFTVPKGTSAEFETGGALYIQYQGNNANDRYAVRVSGGVQVPRLDLYKITDETERLARTKAYVEELETYVANMEAKHNEIHKGSGNQYVDFAYDEKNCILGASDILLDTMMLSLPAQQILSGAGSGDSTAKAKKMLNAMDAMDEMMDLFYQHKGLNSSAPQAKDQIPKGHQNIRYQRMFSGAFMYASGNHIGIEWPETAGMMSGVPITADDGKYQGGSYFGWGIGHEIGHCINQDSYAVAEITNNYFAQLAQARDQNEGMRFSYENIYDKVTSGAKGSSANGATQLGLYWQLHLAYDKGYNYKTYENYTEQLNNLFYARVDTYARDVSKAPKPGGVALQLTSNDTDQNLMRLACAAAEKDILEFFERWGKTPDATTKAYAAQFEKETRAICYVSDDSRVYTLKGGTSSLSADGTTEAVGEVTVKINANAANQVDFTFSSKSIPDEDVLGYEITRCTISGGEAERQAVGFTTKNTFSDSVTTMNNRTVTYEITLVDKYLNRSATKTLEPIKIEHDGSQDKADWTISTSNLTADAEQSDANEDTPCAPTTEEPALKAVDQDVNTVYTAEVSGASAEVTMNFNRNLVITGFKYTAGDGTPVSDYEIQVRSADGEWTKAAEGTFGQNKVNTVYFANSDHKYVSTYEADAVKLVIKNQSGKRVSIAELDVLGVTGDNVDFRRTTDSGTAVIGRLKTAYQYGEKDSDVIPEGSILFTGVYKGNPAYNVVLLFDQNGSIVGGTDEDGNLNAQQIILADVPEEGSIANTSDGTWIYWIEPDQVTDLSAIQKVRAELYRVNDALTNEGQRLVSDSLFEAIPETLPEIELS